LSNDPGYAPGSGNPANYFQNLRTVQLVTGDPNAADKYQNIVAWTNITGLTAHHSSSQDFYGLDAQIGVVDAANAFNLFTIYGTHAVAFLKGAGNIDDGLIGTMGRASAYGSGTIVKHRGVQGWPASIPGATGTSTTVQGVYGLISNDAAGYTMSTAVAGDFLLNSNSGTIGNAYVIRARAETVGAGTITGNRYGVYIANQAIGTVAGVVYNFYSAGARLNVIEGQLGVGTITPAAQLDVFNSAGAQLRLTYSTAAPAHYSDFTVGAGGVLTIAPTGSINFSTVGKQIDPLLGNDENLGSLTKKYKSLHAAELWVETLVAQDTIATIGGRILVGPTTTLTADLTAAATVITVKHNQINSVAPGDVLVMQAGGKIEFMLVTAGPTGAGPYSYTVTRNLDGSGANTWNAGDAVFNTGRAGSGFIDLYSISSINPTPVAPQLGPTIVGNVRNSPTFNDWSEHWAIGNLSGLYGYGATTYGVGLGKYAAGTPHITIDATSGFQVYSGLTNVVARWANDGSITIGQVSATIPRILLDATNGIRMGTTVAVTAQWHPTGFITVGEIGAGLSNVQITSGQLNLRNNTTTYIRLAADGSGFLANSAISWTAAGFLTVNNNASIAGWTISPTSLSAPVSGGSVVIAANADPIFTAGTPNCWFGKSTSGYYGFSTKGTTQALVQIVAGVAAVGVNGRPYFVMSDNNSRYRIIIGELNYTGWGLGGTPLDGATDSMGMKIYDAAGGLIVRFADNVANGGNMISGWTIAPALISSTGVELRSGAAAGLAFGASPSSITASTGTGIFLDRTGLYGLNAAGSPAGVQVKLDAATGALTAGAGAVTINAKGIRIQEGNAAEGNYIKWLSGTSDFFTFCGFQLGSPTPARDCEGQITAKALASETAGSGLIWLEGQNAGGNGSFIKIQCFSAGHATLPNKGLIQIQPAFGGMTYIGLGGSTGFTPSVALKVADGPILLVPMDTTARNALTPTNGMLIYNSTTSKFEGYAAGAWAPLN